jgi:large subunit ribosomal protein L23
MKTAYDIIVKPIITEHSMSQSAERKYTFEVDKRANKTEIKDALEQIFGIDVLSLNTIIVKGKPKRQGRHIGRTRTWKKAIVTLTPNSKEIEFFEGM